MPSRYASKTGDLPFLRILTPFIAGILCNAHDIIPADWFLIALPSSFALFSLFAYPKTLRTRHIALAKNASVLWLLIGMGMVAMGLHEAGLDIVTESPSKSPGKGVWMLVIREPPEKGGNAYRAASEIWRGDGKGAFEHMGGCLAYIRVNEGRQIPTYGARILTSQHPEPMLFKGNPGGFDAQRHYRRQGIAMTVLLDEDRYVLLPETDRNSLMGWVYDTRDRILSILQEHIRNPQALGIAEALLIGYRGHLDRTVADAYAGTGVIHVIAISGLHIGMVYAIAMGIAGLLLGKTAARPYIPLAVLPLLWVFGLMSGGSASVMRSVCMFTLMGLGRSLLSRRGTPLNTLCATAFLLLAFRPSWIADIGFQLSFTAVAGIMLFYPVVRATAAFENRAAAYMWDMVALTLSAQLMTTPLILHHFGRFPLLFLFTNIVAIPLSSMILLAELLLCAASPFPAAARWIGAAVESSILWMNRYVTDMDRIPHATLEDVGLAAFPTLCLYLLVASAFAAISSRSAASLKAACASLCIFSASVAWESAARQRQKLLVVPHYKGRSCVFMVDGTIGKWLVKPPTSAAAGRDHAGQAEAMERHFRVRQSETHSTADSVMATVEWNGRRILVLGRDAPAIPESVPLRPEVIILTDNAEVDPAAWHRKTGCTTWVADGSNSLWKIQKWKTLFAGLPLRLHPTSQKGAFILRD
jgi:competence protein ComEC